MKEIKRENFLSVCSALLHQEELAAAPTEEELFTLILTLLKRGGWLAYLDEDDDIDYLIPMENVDTATQNETFDLIEPWLEHYHEGGSNDDH